MITIKVLWINNNQLEGFPEQIGRLRKLTEIIASENIISELPDSFQYLTSIQTLRIENNKLTSLCLPFAFGNLSSMTDLRIHENSIPEDEAEIYKRGPQHVKRFAKALYEAVETHKLDLGVLALKRLPKNVCMFDFVVDLSIADNDLENLPSEIGQLVNLTYLDCSRNLMSGLPPELSHLHLEVLLMSDNKLFSIPAVVCGIGCNHKQDTDIISGNEVTGVPTLRVLDVARNSIITLPSGIGKLVELEELRINSNKIRHLAHVIENLHHLQILDARDNSVPSLPVELGKCTGLTELYLDNNQLSSIPASIGNLTNLTRFGISNNEITSFPLSLSNLTSLERLDFENNNVTVPCEFIRNKGATIMIKYMNSIVLSIQSKALSLASYSLVEIPGEVFAYKGASALTKLSLYENRFGPSLPHEICLYMPQLKVIDGTRNRLSMLPESFTRLVHLRALLLNENKFDAWPPVLWELTQIETLSVEDNLLTGIPGEIMRLKRVENFKYAGNDIRFPPKEIQLQDLPIMKKFLVALERAGVNKSAEFKSFGLIDFPEFWVYKESPWYGWIPILNLKDNSLKAVPQEISLMTGLTELFLDDNRIQTMAAEICRLPSLTNLQLCNNLISILPENLLEFTGLRYLNLSKNKFEGFPVRLCDIDSLETLIMDENGLEFIPEDIQKLDRLKVLSLAMNRLENLPDSLSTMRTLTELRVNRNMMRDVPNCLKVMDWMKTLKIGENMFEHITEEMSTKSTATMLRYRDMLEKARVEHIINLSNMAIRSIPPELAAIDVLTDLNISNNQIAVIPDFVGSNFPDLLRFDMSYNRISKLPDSLHALKHLNSLNMDHNQLSEIPDSCSYLVSLQRISASYNHIQDITVKLSCLECLTFLDFQYNELIALPSSLSSLINLQTCVLNNNKIMELPGKTIEYMTAMTLLHLHENRLQYLPWELGEMQLLKDFSYTSNELDTPTPEILSLGDRDLMDYMKKVNKSKKTQKLDLSRMRLSLYPAELKTITMVTDLNLSNNKLLEVDAVVAKMRGLTSLNFSNNVLNTLPPALGKCEKIINLDLSFNRISFLPDSLGGLTGLTVLKMNDNRMVRMPIFLKSMMKIQELALQNNEFVDVGADIRVSEQMGDEMVLEPTPEQYKAIVDGAFQSNELVAMLLDKVSQDLHTLKLAGNKLVEWGRWFSVATSLTHLDLDSNKIKLIPSGESAIQNTPYYVLSACR